MARPGRQERNRTARSFRQLTRFHHGINSDEVFGTHSMSQLSASPASTASAHAIGGRTMTFAVSAVSAMAGPVNLRSFRYGQPKTICKRSAKSQAVRDLPVGAYGGPRHHSATAKQ